MEYWPLAVVFVSAFSCCSTPDSGTISAPNGPGPPAGVAVGGAVGKGPCPEPVADCGLAVGLVAQLRNRPGAACWAAAWIAKNAATPTPSSSASTRTRWRAMGRPPLHNLAVAPPAEPRPCPSH